jgi:hypothetical protein
VWRVITDYERLHEVVPALIASEIVPPPIGRPRPPHMNRLRQLAAKKLPYVQLHTEVVLDVLEKVDGTRMELQFKHHKSDFDMLQVHLLATAPAWPPAVLPVLLGCLCCCLWRHYEFILRGRGRTIDTCKYVMLHAGHPVNECMTSK